jgi:hypothetical protein
MIGRVKLAAALLGLVTSSAPALSAAKGGHPSGSASQQGFRAALVAGDVVVEGGGKLRLVELPKDGLLYGPGGDMNYPEPNPGAPSTPRGALIGGAVEAGPGCQGIPQVRGVEGFKVLCPLHPGGNDQVRLGPGDDRLDVNGGGHGRYYNDVYGFLRVPLEVEGGAGDDRVDTQTVGEVRVDAGPGNDRLSLGLSGPHNILRGGPGDDSFFHHVAVSDDAYDGNPAPRTRRVDLDCGAGADFVQPHGSFRHGPGCPHRPPRLVVRPPVVWGSCGEFDCRWRPQRLAVTIRNPSRRAVGLRSARLAIEHWDSDPPLDRRFVTLSRRPRLRVPARSSVALVLKRRGRRAFYRHLEKLIIEWGTTPPLRVSGRLVEGAGDRTTVTREAYISRRHIRKQHPGCC